MTYQFTVSPDFNARVLPDWAIFNTRLQRILDVPVHLQLVDDFALLREALSAETMDIVYANCFDTALLVREKGYLPVVQPQRSDEALVAVSSGSAIEGIGDLSAPLVAAATEAPDVEMISSILLEPRDLPPEALTVVRQKNYVLVAKAVTTGMAGLGFFLKESFDQLSGFTREQLRPIATSHISVVRHALLLHPRLAAHRDRLVSGLLAMVDSASDRQLLQNLGADGWTAMSREDAEFSIDLVSTLA